MEELKKEKKTMDALCALNHSDLKVAPLILGVSVSFLLGPVSLH